MAKKGRTLLIKMVSTAQTGYFFVRSKIRPTGTPARRISQIKFDPKARRHVLFIEKKL
ncbi:hypothetical protein CALCODRAFT_501114 [Calocera cornea HHB12733]|uniref:50S ribosomal protein L33 n=1 Tax=Calocera cornea HHB12733 TaxID=1353952 RepID=A0A165DSA8_9BASI|nr:hypothetical protein CALCODRAFT_501114 [Calocera cornea HHB12733]